MAIFIEGMICSLCDKPMEKGSDLISFPQFVQNRKDSLFPFSDNVFHANCFKEHPLSEAAERILEIKDSKIIPGKYICDICNHKIIHPDEYLSLGLLTSNENNALYEFNFFQSHKSCFSKCGTKQKILELLKESTEEWDSDNLNTILDIISKI